jgi:hypothetical protein
MLWSLMKINKFLTNKPPLHGYSYRSIALLTATGALAQCSAFEQFLMSDSVLGIRVHGKHAG